jgi:hypothetical protein
MSSRGEQFEALAEDANPFLRDVSSRGVIAKVVRFVELETAFLIQALHL